MKLFIQWARLHKIKFTLLVLFAFACAAILRADLVWGLVVMALGYGAWAIVYALDTNSMLAVLVAASIPFVQSRESVTEDLAGHGLSAATGLGFYRVTTMEP